MKQKLRVADVLRLCWSVFNGRHRLPPHVARAAEAIQDCRTDRFGGHLYACDQCGSEVPVYNSCKNRNCPTCQTVEKENWLRKQMLHLLPVPYYHVVFTLPHDLNELINANRKLLLGLLFTLSNRVLQAFAHDPQWHMKGELGVLSVLHSWNQRLHQHYHVHCLVPGGAWQEKKKKLVVRNTKWLFKRDSLSAAFKKAFTDELEKLYCKGKLQLPKNSALTDPLAFELLLRKLRKTKWVVYPKSVPASPEKTLEYLARYTHRVAISDGRIKEIKNGQVTFTWRDRSDGNKEKTETIPLEEFTQRFLQHILPPGFKKIRSYGWLSNAKRKQTLKTIRDVLGTTAPELREETIAETLQRRYKIDITSCPACRKGTLEKQSLTLAPT